MIEVSTVKKHVEDFLNQTLPARELSERDRDYKDNKQWTAEQVSRLASRGQAAITDNRIKPKVEGLKGLLIQRRSDPKGYARTKKHEEASEAVTDALRYVADNIHFDDLELDAFDNVIVEGYGGCIIDVKQTKKGVEINPTLIPWDRIYFDPHARRADFKDAQYMGIILWMDVDVAKQTFKGKKAAEIIDQALASDGDIDETFEDRPRWRETMEGRKRIRVAQEFYLHEGVWHMCVFTGDQFLVEPKPSTYLDEDGNPENPVELVGAYIDRDNNRYGEVRFWIDPQNEINHRRSKFLFMLSARQTFGRKGEAKDVATLKRELAKPDGHVEFNGQKFGDDFGIIPTGDMAEAQFKLLEEQKQSLDSVSFNAQLSGERQGDLSGVAVQSLQMAGMLEVNSLFANMAGWKRRVFRQIWYRIKQHWTAEKWVRVTDDYNKLRFVGFNVPITRQQEMEDFIQDESNPMQERQQAQMLYQMLVQAQDPRLQEVREVKNPVAELDMDIILEQSTNSINVQQEQFRILAELAAGRPEIPFTALLKLSELRDKDDIIKDIEAKQQQAMAMQAQAAQLESAEKQVTIQGKQLDNVKKKEEVGKAAADTTLTNMKAISEQIQNVNLLNAPDPKPQVSQ